MKHADASDLSPFPRRLMTPISISAYTATSAFGCGCDAMAWGLMDGHSRLKAADFPGLDFETFIGRIEGIEDHLLPASLGRYDARNNRIIDLALDQDGFRSIVADAVRCFGADRIAVIMGTSTSGILETERAYQKRNPIDGSLPSDFRYQECQNTSAPAAFVQASLGLSGPAWVISTACSSSSKVFASAARLLRAGWCDAVVVGGADSLCLTTLYGFQSLGLLSTSPCRPMDRDRTGISIGEGAGFMLLTLADRTPTGIALLGYGESSDAYHMSTPHPEGRGAARAISECLDRANIAGDQVDWIYLHGTATQTNDPAEDKAVTQILGPGASGASIKGAIGHTLGAAGIMNAVAACLSIRDGFQPGTCNLQNVDPSLEIDVQVQPRHQKCDKVLTNAFGFGGSNAVLLFGTQT